MILQFDQHDAILVNATKWMIRDWSEDGLQMPDRDATPFETEILDRILELQREATPR